MTKESPTRPRSEADDASPREALLDELGQLSLPLMWTLSQAATRAFEPLGFRPAKALVLGIVASGTRTPKELAELLDMTPPTTSAMLSDLEDRGFIVRRIDPEDRRRVLVEATEEGHAMTERFREAWNQAALERTDGLTDDDLRHLVRIYGRVVTRP